MQFKAILVTSALSALAAATHTVTVTSSPPASTPPPASQCNTGGLQCCNSVQQANSSGVISALLTSLNIAVSPVDALVGVTCTPINVLGIGSGGACTAQPVCCQNNNFNGVIAIGCTPVTIGL